MTGDEAGDEAGPEAGAADRRCAACDEPLPEGRSVCPACGTLQPIDPEAAEAPIPGRRGNPAPVPAAPDRTGAPAGPAAGAGPARRFPRRLAVALAAVVVLAAALGGAVLLDRDDDQDDAVPTSTTATEGTAGRVDAIRAYCDAPRALTEPAPIAEFAPGGGAVAYVDVPRPVSSTEPATDLTVQVSPAVGAPDLELDEAVNLVSLAVCIDETKAERSRGTCAYELTNADSLGEKATARVLATTYAIEVRELRTGKVLVDGTLTTPVDRCPDLAYLDPGEGVSNPLDEEQILGWLAINLPGGRPA